MAPCGLYSTQSVTRLYPAASAASVVLNFAVAWRTFRTSRSTASPKPLGRIPGAWLVSLSPACASGATMKTIVTNNNPVNPLNFFIIVVLLELVLVSSLRRIVIAVQNRSTEVFDGVSGDDDELDLASGKWGWSLRQAAWSKD